MEGKARERTKLYRVVATIRGKRIVTVDWTEDQARAEDERINWVRQGVKAEIRERYED